MKVQRTQVSRRTFLVLTQAAGAGLVLGGYWPGSGTAAQRASAPWAPNPFLQVAPNGEVTIWATKPDMGQGAFTSIPMLVAEELAVDWTSIKVVQAGADKRYGDQLSGGSMGTRTAFMPLRQAGATARAMLIAAAAKRWGVDASTCVAENGAVRHDGSRRRLTYGELAADAATMPVPKDAPLRTPAQFTLIGKPVKRLDSPAKVDGSAIFGMDVRVPNMVYAVLAHPPAFGGDIVSVDDSAALKVPGVKRVVRIPRTELIDYYFMRPTKPGTNYFVKPSVAVIADSTYAAKKGRDALKIVWKGPDAPLDTATLRAQLKAKTDGQPWKTLTAEGQSAEAIATAAKTVEAVYEAPLIAHATMEPLVATAHMKGDTCEIWAPTQHPQGAQTTIATMLGVPVEQVKVNVTFVGGGFGRKAQFDFIAEAVLLSKVIGAPVKVVYTREDDMRNDLYRQASYHTLAAGLDANNRLIAWRHRLAATPMWTSAIGGPVDLLIEIPHMDFPHGAVPNYLIEFTPHHTVIPIGPFRSVEASYNSFVIQSFIDELAAAAGKDPLAFRLELLGDRTSPKGQDYRRLRAVIELAASKAKWGTPLPKGRARGIAAQYSFATYVAQVAEVEVAADGTVRVHRIVTAVDCGTVVNPLAAAAQFEGAIVMGLSQALKHEITLKNGGVEQGNFDTFPVLRINEMPAVEVYFVDSQEPPTGIGEPGVPPTAPAVANAIFAATGKRVRKMPIRPADLVKV